MCADAPPQYKSSSLSWVLCFGTVKRHLKPAPGEAAWESPRRIVLGPDGRRRISAFTPRRGKSI
eukprot:2607870-Pyramimonas_sp.AAC.1